MKEAISCFVSIYNTLRAGQMITEKPSNVKNFSII